MIECYELGQRMFTGPLHGVDAEIERIAQLATGGGRAAGAGDGVPDRAAAHDPPGAGPHRRAAPPARGGRLGGLGARHLPGLRPRFGAAIVGQREAAATGVLDDLIRDDCAGVTDTILRPTALALLADAAVTAGHVDAFRPIYLAAEPLADGWNALRSALVRTDGEAARSSGGRPRRPGGRRRLLRRGPRGVRPGRLAGLAGPHRGRLGRVAARRRSDGAGAHARVSPWSSPSATTRCGSPGGPARCWPARENEEAPGGGSRALHGS